MFSRLRELGLRRAPRRKSRRCVPPAGACHQHGAAAQSRDPLAEQARCEDGRHCPAVPEGGGAEEAQLSPSLEARGLGRTELDHLSRAIREL